MKIIFLASFFLFLSFGTAVAQFRLGPLAGGSVSRFIYEDEEYKSLYKTSFKPGYHVGMALNYRVSKLYSLHTEFSYMKKGIKVRYTDALVNIHNRAGFHYLSAPVLLRFSFHKNIGHQHIEYYANVGPEVNYWLGGRGVLETSERADFIKDEELKYKVSFKEDQDFGNHMIVKDPSRVQMSLGLGGGAIVDLSRTQNLAFDVRASLGIGKSFHGNQDGGQYGLNMYAENLEGVHHTLSVTAAYLMNFDLKMLRKGKAIRR